MSAERLESYPTGETQQIDVDTWRALKNALRFAIPEGRIDLFKNELPFVLSLFMDQIERSGLRVVPIAPTIQMHIAMKRALDDGMGGAIYRVRQRTKQRWRYRAALDAAPNWRKGYEQEKNSSEG